MDDFNLDKIDYSSFRTGSQDEEEQRQRHVRMNLKYAAQRDPKEFARLLKASQQTGVPADVIGSELKKFETDINLDKIDFNTLTKDNPKTSEYLSKYDNAVLSQNDVSTLTGVENWFKGVFSGLGTSIGLGFEKQSEGVRLHGLDLRANTKKQEQKSILGGGVGFSDMQGPSIDDPEKIKADIQTSLQNIRSLKEQEKAATPENLSVVQEGIRGGIQSLAQTLPGLVASVAARNPAPLLVTAGAGQYADSYAEGREGGLTPEQSRRYAAIDAAVEVATEMLPAGSLVKMAGGKFKGKTAKELANFLIKDMGGEQVATFLQSMNAYGQGLDEELNSTTDLKEMAQIQLRRQAVTAVSTLVAGGVQASVAHAAGKTLERIDARNKTLDNRTEQDQKHLNALNELSKKSELKQVDPERFMQFIEENNGDKNAQVFIDGAQLSLYLKQVKDQNDPAVQRLKERAEEAVQEGNDAAIPVAEFATFIAGSEHFDALKPFMHINEDTVAPFRKDDEKRRLEVQMNSLVEQARQNTSSYVEAQDIFNSVKQQLVDTGRYNAQNADTMARIVPAWATVYARENGISVADAYKRSGLTIEGPQAGVDNTGGALEQFAGVSEISLESELSNKLQSVFTSNGGEGDIDESTNEYAKSLAFAELARAEGYTVSEPGSSYFYVNKETDKGEISIKVRVSDHSNVNRGQHFGDTIINIAPDDGYARDTFASALWKLRNASVDDDLNTTIDGRSSDDFAFFQSPSTGITKGYYSPSQSLIRLTEASDLSTFLHEFAHFMFEQELVSNNPNKLRKVYDWVNSNAAEVAKEASGYLGRSVDTLEQTVTVDGKERSTTNSDGKPLGRTPKEIENFWRWFGDSKVVDEQGRPKVVYHGTSADFEEFKVNSKGLIFTTPSSDFTHDFITEASGDFVQGSNIIPVLVHVKNPFDYENRLHVDTIAKRTGLNPNGRKELKQGKWQRIEDRTILEAIKASGFDGIYVAERGNKNLAVFNPEQIKSAIGNEGTFDPENPSILKQGEQPGEGTGITEEDIKAYTDNQTTGDQTKDDAIRRAIHEQFARGFEAYLMEGKAPTVELRNIFATFARWLSQIYKQIRSGLNVNLNNDIREVFDRMLATEEQLEAARVQEHLQPLFTDAVMAGMTEDQFTKYQERIEQAKNKESETLRDKLIKQLTRQTEDWWKQEHADAVREEMKRLETEPVYRAIDTLKGEGGFKLDRATVKQLYGEKGTDKRGREYLRVPTPMRDMTITGARGVHPDQAAAFFNFGSGDEMVKAIVEALPRREVAEKNADRIMKEHHGDILTDGTIERQADEALKNEERGKLLLDELNTLATKNKQPTVSRKAVREMATEMIGKLSYREMHPAKYRTAEIRAAQEAGAAFAAGDKLGALSAKRKQVLNYYLGKAAIEAHDEINKIVEHKARYNTKEVKQEIMKAGEDYWAQLNRILERFEFRKSATLGQVERVNQSLNTWMKDKIEKEGDGLLLNPVILDEGYVTHWKNVTLNDLRGIDESVKNIEHVARYANRMTKTAENESFQEVVDKWVTSMNRQPDVYKPQRTTTVEGRNWAKWAMAGMTKIPFMASWLDGGERVGISHRILVQPLVDAQHEEQKLWGEVGKKVMDAIKNRSKEDVARHARKVFIPELKDEKNDGNLFGGQVLVVALNTGNEGNLRKMLLGEEWATEDDPELITIENETLQAILKHMTKSDWDLVQLVWNEMDKLYPQLAEVHRRSTGIALPKVQAVAVQTPFGEYKGGYYPVKYDPERGFRAERNEERQAAQFESLFATNGSIQSSVNAGATNERTGYYDPIKLNLSVISEHFQETIRYITHHEAVREINKLINNELVADTIKAKLGPEEFKLLKPWLNDVAKDGKDTGNKHFLDSVLQRLKLGTTLGVMGFKVSTGILQISGLSNTAAEVGFKNTLYGVRQVLGSVKSMRDSWEFAKANSKVLEHRVNSMDREIKNAMKQLEDKRGFIAAVQEASMKHIALIQTYMVDLPSWYAAYTKALGEHGNEDKAYQYADWVVEQIQGSGATKDLALIMRNQHPATQLLTMFMTYFSSLWNVERDTVRGAKSGLYSPTTVAAKVAFLFLVSAVFEGMLRGGPPDEDPEEMLQRMLANAAMTPVQSVPFARDIVNGVAGDYGYNMSPVASIIGKGLQGAEGMTDGDITKTEVKNASKLAGAALGIPGTAQAWVTGEHLYDVLVEGEDLTLRQLLIGPTPKK